VQHLGEEVSAMPLTKCSWLFLLGDTKSYIFRCICEGSGLVTTKITMVVARAIVRKYNPGLNS